MTVKFNKDGKTVAVLKDSASEPEGIVYLEDNVLDDSIVVNEDVASLEEMDAEKEKTE